MSSDRLRERSSHHHEPCLGAVGEAHVRCRPPTSHLSSTSRTSQITATELKAFRQLHCSPLRVRVRSTSTHALEARCARVPQALHLLHFTKMAMIVRSCNAMLVQLSSTLPSIIIPVRSTRHSHLVHIKQMPSYAVQTSLAKLRTASWPANSLPPPVSLSPIKCAAAVIPSHPPPQSYPLP